jgi:hypothetical protein
MRKTATLMTAMLLVAYATGCNIKDGQRVSRNKDVYKHHPIAVRVHSKVIDEDSPVEYTIRIRNAGRQIASFDYTVADQPGVPHVDRDGPNSGFIPNLYPGAEVANPLKTKRVWVTLGTVTYGKKSPTELDSVYRPNATPSVEPAADFLLQ